MKIFANLSSIFSVGASKCLSPVSALLADSVSTEGKLLDKDIFMAFVEFVGSVLYKIIFLLIKFLLNILDVLQYAVYKLMGIGSVLEGGDYVVIDDTNPLIRFLTNEFVLKAFSSLMIVAIIFIIGFTIISIIMSEYKAAAAEGENTKFRIFGRSLRSLLLLSIFPAILVAGIVLVNALLAGFNNVFYKNGVLSMGNVLFEANSTTASRYRIYAENGKRIPILIDFDDPYQMHGNVEGYTSEELYFIYNKFDERGGELYKEFAYGEFTDFKDTLNYQNNTVKNSSSYVGFEKFLCTPEQYYVMADFLEYAFTRNIEFTIKNVKDDDIDWRYVNEAIFNKEDSSLTITYKDASNLTGDDECYTITYTPTSLDVSTPIADAFDSIMNILAIGDHEDNVFNIMSRDDESINVVFWEKDQVTIQLSKNYKTNPTYTDLIILFEYFRYDHNNTLDCSIEDLENGFNLPLKKLERREWRTDLQDYYTTNVTNVVEINGSYYLVTKTSDEETKSLFINYYSDLYNKKDSFGDYCYALIPMTSSPYAPIRTSTSGADSFGAGNSILVDVLINNKYLNFKKDNTFADVRVDKLNGTFENQIINSNGDIVYTYAFYDDRVTDITKKVNWPQKLMQDMQTIYADININLLISTGDWLTKLSTIVGSTANGGEYGQTFDTSLIHPLGLMLSELFLNEVCENNETYYGDYKFVSSLSEEEIRAILLACCGEDQYYQLSKQVEYFVEIFNAYMAPVLDDIAYRENIDLVSGTLASEQLYTYKAYLCSILLSSSCARYLFNSTAAIVGANEFAYGILEYQDIVNEVYNEIKNPAITKNTEPIYVYVTVNKDDYKKLYIDKNGNTVNSFDSLMKETEYDYNTFVSHEIFSNIEEFFIRDDDGNINYSAIQDKIEYGLDYSVVDDYEKKNEIVNQIMTRVIVVVNSGISNTIDGIVSSVYKKYEDIDQKCRDYLSGGTNSNGTVTNGIFDLIMQEVNENDIDIDTNKDFEYVKVLQNYINGNIDRWEFIKHANVSNISSSVGNLGKLSNEFNDIKKQVKDIDAAFSFKYLLSNLVAKLNGEYRTMFQTLMLLYNDLEYEKSVLLNENIKLPEMTPIEFFNEIDSLLYDSGISGLSRIDSIDISDIFAALSVVLQSLFEDVKIDRYTDNTVEKNNIPEYMDFINIFEGIEQLIDIASTGRGDNAVRATNVLRKIQRYFEEYNKQFFDANFDKIDFQREGREQKSFNTLGSYAKAVNIIRETGSAIGRALDNIAKRDSLTKYYITYAVSSYVSSHLNTEFDVVVNGKHYTVGSNFTSAKLAEYVLGGEFLSEYGYGLNFVDEDYKGLVKVQAAQNIDFGIANFEILDTFVYLREFLCNFGEIAVNVYNITNFDRLDQNSRDELDITSKSVLAKYILKFLVEGDYITKNNLISFFDINIEDASIDTDGDSYFSYEELKVAALKVIEECSDVVIQSDFSEIYKYYFQEDLPVGGITLKELRIRAINKIINFEKTANTEEENQKNFMALFNIACADWKQSGDDVDCDYEDNAAELASISGLASSQSSMGVVLKLAGIENRPYEELVNLEYTINFNTDLEDEANGDVFVVCIYDKVSMMYVPFMMTNSDKPTGNSLQLVDINNTPTDTSDDVNWMTSFAKYDDAVTSYYTNNSDRGDLEAWFPIIARGVFDKRGNPTAIRRVDGNIEFYREDVVIRSASKVGLSTYYMAIEDVRIKTGFVGSVINFAAKLFTGKSLTEAFLDAVPRIAIESDLNFPFGVDENHIGTAINSSLKLSYNMGSDKIQFDSFYDTSKINMLIFLLAVIMLFTFVTKAFWGCVGRIMDITVLFILSPIAISTVSLRTDKKDNNGNYQEQSDGFAGVYDKWKTRLIDKIILAFGYIFGLNIFYMLAPMISDFTLFTSNEPFANLPVINLLSLDLLNEFGFLIFLVALSSVIGYAPKLLATVMNFTESFGYANQIHTNVQNTIKEVQDAVSGRKLMDDAADAWDMVKSVVPGSEIMSEISDRFKEIKYTVSAKIAKSAAISAGIPPEVAEKAAKSYKNARMQEIENRKKRKEKKEKERKDRNEERQKLNPS